MWGGRQVVNVGQQIQRVGEVGALGEIFVERWKM